MVIVLAIIVLEALARREVLKESTLPMLLQVSSDRELGWELVPSAEIKGEGVTYNINSKGFRGPEFNAEKAPGGFRVLCIGDSMTFGLGLQDDRTFPARLEQILKKYNPKADVINMSVPGYNTRQELNLFNTRGIGYNPDAVILGYCRNDLVNFQYNPKTGQLLLSTSDIPVNRLGKTVIGIVQNSFIFQWVLGPKWAKRKKDMPPEEVARMELKRAEIIKASWKTNTDRLREFKKICDKNNIDCYFLAFPFKNAIQFSDNDILKKWQEPYREACKDIGIKYLDIFPPYEKLGVKAFVMPDYRVYDDHPSAEAAYAIAKIAGAALVRNHPNISAKKEATKDGKD